ncbi:hypothetical protein [Ilyobacter polytropus]|uniref:Uncharacterized protein n=1 Tax=Ilyobacter polytropus (strain ATCC 51220 / DSM 2926 / LMG 16218 / CuHBu1) TaxID=572544 RepID=E3H8C0_ILYPC|nr:hypothetical protein [Ilyobacter polytropus]ADO82687.1 hypothetical protein Ilyop_0902 [Ilyobacter polytropus DSM 2926]
MDISEKIKKIKKEPNKDSESSTNFIIINSVYPKTFKDMEDNHMMNYYKRAKTSYEASKEAIRKIEEELEKRKPLV